ncbi:MAG: c-type cytochrome, partial [Dehalococcoidia bacterium]
NSPALAGSRAAALILVEAEGAEPDIDVANYVAETRSAEETVAFLREHREALFAGEDTTDEDVEQAIVDFLVKREIFNSEGAAVAALEGGAPPAGDDKEPQPEPDEPVVGGEPDPARGQEIYFANACNICHGDAGQGGIGPTIASTRFTLEQELAQYRNPRGTMPSFDEDTIANTEVADILAWLQTLPLPDTIVPGAGTP